MSPTMEIVNVVATGNIRGTVNLEHLFAAAEDRRAEYDPAHHQGCYISFKEENETLITIYNSGALFNRYTQVDSLYFSVRRSDGGM